MRLTPLLSLVVTACLSGCAATELAPPPDDAHPAPMRLPLPRYVTDDRAPRLGGAAWRAGHRAHALELDGQRCGLTLRGAVRCRRPTMASMPPSRAAPKPSG